MNNKDVGSLREMQSADGVCISSYTFSAQQDHIDGGILLVLRDCFLPHGAVTVYSNIHDAKCRKSLLHKFG
jgi:hypothetical protein